MRRFVPLLLAGSLALGCASAHAQEGDPGKDPKGRAAAAEAAAGARAEEMAQRVAQLLERAEAAEGRERAELHLEAGKLLWAHEHHERAIHEVERALAVDPVFTQAHAMLDDMRADRRAMDERRRVEELEQRHRRDAERGGRGGRRGGPHGGTEERIERLERAVHDMARLLEHHGVGPEARERALREMRGRRGPRGERPRRLHDEGERAFRPGLRMPRFRITDPEADRLAASLWVRQIDEALAGIAATEREGAAEELHRASRELARVAAEMAAHAGERAEGRRGPRGPGPRGERPREDGSRGERRGPPDEQRAGRRGGPGGPGGGGGAGRGGPPPERGERHSEVVRQVDELREALTRQEAEAAALRQHVKELEQRLKEAQEK